MYTSRKQTIYNHFESIAAGYIKYRKRFSYYNKDIENYLNFFLRDSDTILEIGCGPGETIHHLKGREKTGIDFSPQMIDVAKAN
jgi:SAM-dependent methyltransferase